MKKFTKGLSYGVFWAIQCTWGIIMTLIGAIAVLGLIIAGKKPHRLGPVIYIEVGKSWGGVELGGFFICSENSPMSTKYHECGHALQNLIWGPLFPFIIAIPSATRYWLREFKTHLTKSLFNLFYLLIALVVTTGLACITGAWLHIKWLTIVIECLRMYFLLVSIWMSTIEIRKYDKGYVDYDAIWFEGQATRWGTKIFKK